MILLLLQCSNNPFGGGIKSAKKSESVGDSGSAAMQSGKTKIRIQGYGFLADH